ncbi:hypothetical protein MAR_007476 [Mya arenaria]|uniref:Uncharacterized protein n=2 Tax=Mya arenaria TaxID=6604 RepID=A0ABY7DF81_MYAAR|nr:hypothetical protein MAR_007476 [Mya arenaria]
MSDKKGELKEYNSSWPTLEFSWSFALMAGGLILNLVSSAIFLTILLIKGERKASRSTKGLGPSSAKMDKGISGDKVPIISVISHENEAFNNDDAFGNGSNYGNTDTQEYDVISGNTSLGFAGPVDAEIVQERSKVDSDPTRHNYMNDDGACAKVNINSDGKGKMQANQSSIENEVEPDFYNIASQHTDIVTDLDADSYNENGPYEILDIQAHIDDEDYTSIRL